MICVSGLHGGSEELLRGGELGSLLCLSGCFLTLLVRLSAAVARVNSELPSHSTLFIPNPG